MRVFAIGLVVVTISAFIAFAVFMSNVRIGFVESADPRPELSGVKVAVASAQGWDVITGRQVVGASGGEAGTCADPYDAMPDLTHAGRRLSDQHLLEWIRCPECLDRSTSMPDFSLLPRSTTAALVALLRR